MGRNIGYLMRFLLQEGRVAVTCKDPKLRGKNVPLTGQKTAP